MFHFWSNAVDHHFAASIATNITHASDEFFFLLLSSRQTRLVEHTRHIIFV